MSEEPDLGLPEPYHTLPEPEGLWYVYNLKHGGWIGPYWVYEFQGHPHIEVYEWGEMASEYCRRGIWLKASMPDLPPQSLIARVREEILG